MAFQIRWLGTACFEIRIEGGKTIVIDPYLEDSDNAPVTSDQIEACDYIFLTHGHYDHVLDVGKLAGRFNSEIYCSREVADALIEQQGIDPGRFTSITAGDVVEKGGLRVEVLQGMHVDFVSEYQRITGGEVVADSSGDFKAMLPISLRALLGPVTPPDRFEEWMNKYPGGEQLNYVFDTGGGKRVYMAGTYPDPSLIEVAKGARSFMTLLQVIPGKTIQGREDETVQLALASGAEIVVPQHHDPLMKGAYLTDLSKLKSLFEKHKVKFVEFTPGEWQRYE